MLGMMVKIEQHSRCGTTQYITLLEKINTPCFSYCAILRHINTALSTNWKGKKTLSLNKPPFINTIIQNH